MHLRFILLLTFFSTTFSVNICLTPDNTYAESSTQKELCKKEPQTCHLLRLGSYIYFTYRRWIQNRPVIDTDNQHIFHRLCDAQFAQACTQLGIYYKQTDLHLKAPDYGPDYGLNFTKKGCQFDDPMGCHLLSIAYMKGEGVEPNTDTALTYLAKACKHGNYLPSCRSLARIYTRTRYKSAEKAYEYQNKACELGELYACGEVGLTQIRTVPQDQKGGLIPILPLLTQGCKGNHPQACGALGSAYITGLGIDHVDVQKGIELSTQSCALKSKLSCLSLAQLYLVGKRVQQDKLKAWRFSYKGCQLAHEPSCLMWIDLTLNHHDLGINNPKAIDEAQQGADFFCKNRPSIQSCSIAERYMVYRMKNTPKLSPQAYEYETLHLIYVNQLCELDQWSSCNQLGLLYALGTGSQNQKEPQRAVSFFKKGCQGGYVESCIHLGKAYLQGKGIETDQKRGQELLQKACKQGYKVACQ